MLRQLGLVAAATVVAASSVAPAAQTRLPSAEEVLERVGDYVAAYVNEATNIVAEEDYHQVASGNGPNVSRRLRSDLAIILDERVGWVAFRDVFEMDGRPVRDREDRLGRLFLEPQPDAVARARAIAGDSARFNINPTGVEIVRTINVPVTALRFVQAENRARSAFRLESVTSDGRQLARLRFTERGRPRLVASPDNAAATGFVVVQPDTGIIVETDLTIATGDIRANFRTLFASTAPFRSWMPRTMEETYVSGASREPRSSGRIDARATYTNFRRFGVSVDTATNPDTPTP